MPELEAGEMWRSMRGAALPLHFMGGPPQELPEWNVVTAKAYDRERDAFSSVSPGIYVIYPIPVLKPIAICR